jgi:hypothetical protein
MDNVVIQTMLWVLAVGGLAFYMNRRNNGKMLP